MWHTAHIASEDDKQRQQDIVKLLQSSAVANAAVFADRTRGRSSSCRIFLTPEASRLAVKLLERLAARPCEPPSLETATLIAGDENAWKLLG